MILLAKTKSLFVLITIRPLRLMVRTPGFHPDNRGSIPLGVTKKEHEISCSFFLFFRIINNILCYF